MHSSGARIKVKYEGVLYNTASFGTLPSPVTAPLSRPPPVTHKSSSELFITTRPSLYGDDGRSYVVLGGCRGAGCQAGLDGYSNPPPLM